MDHVPHHDEFKQMMPSNHSMWLIVKTSFLEASFGASSGEWSACPLTSSPIADLINMIAACQHTCHASALSPIRSSTHWASYHIHFSHLVPIMLLHNKNKIRRNASEKKIPPVDSTIPCLLFVALFIHKGQKWPLHTLSQHLLKSAWCNPSFAQKYIIMQSWATKCIIETNHA